MQNLKISGNKQFGKNSIKFDLPLFLFEEDSTWFAYLPSLDLTGYGKTEGEAKESLKVVLEEFLRYTINKNILFIEMKRLGWQVKSKKKPMHAPEISDLINTNNQLKEIINYKNYSTSHYQVNVPAFA